MGIVRNANRSTQKPQVRRERMPGRFRGLRLLPLLGPLALCLNFAASAAGQSPRLSVQKIPVGQRPMGVASSDAGRLYESVAVVANSGDNSVTVLRTDLVGFPSASRVIPGIPSPYGVSDCYLGGVGPYNYRVYVATSPSADSISFIDTSKATVIATVKVGSKPYSAACFGSSVFVSNYGDNAVSILDTRSFTVTRTIPNVPGNRGLHGVLIAADQSNPPPNPQLWIAGTDANVVTVIDSVTGALVASIPVLAPTFLRYSYPGLVHVGSAIENASYGFDTRTLAATFKSTGVPNPQDSALTAEYGWLVTTGSANSVVSFRPGSNQPPATFVSAIPGAAGITTSSLYYFTSGTFILVTSPDSNSVYFIQPAAPPPIIPNQFSIAGASFGSVQAAPGGLASAFAPTGVVQSFFASLPLPKTLGGVSLRFGGSLTLNSTTSDWVYSPAGSIDAPLLFVGSSQINFQVPPGIAPGTSIPAQITRPDGITLLTTVSIVSTAPGIFTVLQNGTGQAAVLNQDNSFNFGTNPAKRGSVIQIFATGAGDTTPALAAGEAAPASGNPLVLTKVQPTVTIGGKNAPVQFSGMAPGFVGLWQINAQIPQDVTPGMTVPLVITAGGAASNTVTIAVQ